MLIPVLAALFLLGMVAILLSRSVALDIRVTSLAMRRAVVEELADGLMRLSIRHLAVNAPVSGKSGPFRIDGIAMTCRTERGLASIAFTDADGLINLNRASIPLLELVFTGAGLSRDEAKQLAENVADFRTPGDSTLSGGSKANAYQLAGLRHTAKSGPFDSVAELDQVVGMSTALLQRVRPLMTVHSRFGTINPGVASLPVLEVLAGLGESSGVQTAEAVDDLRSKVVVPPDFTYVPITRSVRQTKSDTYVIRVIVDEADARAGRQAVVVRDPGGQDGQVKEWSTVDAHTLATYRHAATDAPPCLNGLLWLQPPQG